MDESRRRRACDVDIPWTSRGDAAAATWKFDGSKNVRPACGLLGLPRRLRAVFPAVRAETVAEHVARARGDANRAAETLVAASQRALEQLAADDAKGGALSEESAFFSRRLSKQERDRLLDEYHMRPPIPEAGHRPMHNNAAPSKKEMKKQTRYRAGPGGRTRVAATPRRRPGACRSRRRRGDGPERAGRGDAAATTLDLQKTSRGATASIGSERNEINGATRLERNDKSLGAGDGQVASMSGEKFLVIPKETPEQIRATSVNLSSITGGGRTH